MRRKLSIQTVFSDYLVMLFKQLVFKQQYLSRYVIQMVQILCVWECGCKQMNLIYDGNYSHFWKVLIKFLLKRKLEHTHFHLQRVLWSSLGRIGGRYIPKSGQISQNKNMFFVGLANILGLHTIRTRNHQASECISPT